MTDATHDNVVGGGFRYSVSGSAAHKRLMPLLPNTWSDCSPSFCRGRGSNNNSKEEEENPGPTTEAPHFVWENAPRKDTKPYRDSLKAYSHLPNGTAILDSKWVLARLLEHKQQQRRGEKDSSSNSSKEEEDPKFPLLAALESHCFRGPDGYAAFCDREFSNASGKDNDKPNATTTTTTTNDSSNSTALFPDLLVEKAKCPAVLPPEPSNLWVVKDAFSNGAGGIWVVDKASAHTLRRQSSSATTSMSTANDGPLYRDHRYVAQRYTWPPVLYGGRKCHVRVYGLITADGRAFVHRRAFLHVANDAFSYENTPAGSSNDGEEEGANSMDNGEKSSSSSSSSSKTKRLEDSVHITNCCANSHDDSKFAGEILADLEATEFAVESETGQTIVPLGPFFPSMKASLAALTERSMPYLSGGRGNNGFEYLGMDFILSYKDFSNTDTAIQQQEPVAYMLEVNAPPSQDTATGLKHAEDLHDDVIRDILTLWVFPKVTDGVYPENPGGWRLAYTPPPGENEESDSEDYILPSKATIINKIRWGMVERRAMKKQVASDASPGKEESDASRYVTSQRNNEVSSSKTNPATVVSTFARTKFPFFLRTDSVACDATEETCKNNDEDNCHIFWENAGGSQVPCHVIEDMSESLRHRNRSVIGSKAKEGARSCFGKILGAYPEDYSVFLGANASSLLTSLASQYVQLGLLQEEDEIVLSTENHLANVTPWLMAAKMIGAKVRWWAPTRAHHKAGGNDIVSADLEDLLTHKTRILAISHASNVLGQVRDLSCIRSLVNNLADGYAHLVVDGVAAAPHWYPALSDHQVDWYVVSCHKLFGPHLGGLCGRRSTAVIELCCAAGIDPDCKDSLYKLLEIGTVNYEGCSGLEGLGEYFVDLATVPLDQEMSPKELGDSLQAPYQSPREGPVLPSVVARERKTRSLLTSGLVAEAYRRIRLTEEELLNPLLSCLRKSEKVRVIEIEEDHLSCVARLPVVSFVHEAVKSSTIVDICSKNGIACRHGAFLSNPYLLEDFDVSSADGVVRLSLVHYNTCREVKAVENILHSIPGWF